MENTLYYGDNLPVLREHIKDESVDLIYLDPPFNSNRSYNVLFRDESGNESDAQIIAFNDTWHWGHSAEEMYEELVTKGSPHVSSMISAMKDFIGRNQMMAYLVMMAARLSELYRVLKSTGSIYLHCDPTASHYLKIITDSIFDIKNFRSEIIWRRTGSHNKVNRFAPIHDVLLFYTKSDNYFWSYPKRPFMKGHIEDYFVKDEKGYRTNYYGNVLTGSGIRSGESGEPWMGFDPTAKGRHWAIPGALISDIDEDFSELTQRQKLDRLYELGHIKIVEGQAWPMYERYLNSNDGQPVSDIWAYQPYTEGTVFNSEEGIDSDVRWLSPQDQERLGFQTQKPIALLERIIKASSKPGDVVLDPFSGCGTSICAAQKLGRKWIGIDITYLAIALHKSRLKTMFLLQPKKDYQVIGEPVDLSGSNQLAHDDRYQFQWWALSLIEAKPLVGDREGKKGSDKGIDGVINFIEPDSKKPRRIIVQVKSGNVNSQLIRELRGVLDREQAQIGVFITLEPPTSEMEKEAISSGFYTIPKYQKNYPRVQILTIEQLLNGVEIKMPPLSLPSFKEADFMKSSDVQQGKLGL